MKEPRIKKWKVSVIATAYKEIEAKDLVEAGDKVAKWADNNPYELWHWFSTNAHTVSGDSIEELKNGKIKRKQTQP